MRHVALLAAAAVALAAAPASAQDLKVALIHGKTGPLEAYAKQTETACAWASNTPPRTP